MQTFRSFDLIVIACIFGIYTSNNLASAAATDSLSGSEKASGGCADPEKWQHFNPQMFKASQRLVPHPSVTDEACKHYPGFSVAFPQDPTRSNIIYGRGTKGLPTFLFAKAYDVLMIGNKYFQAPAAGMGKQLIIDNQPVFVYGTSVYTPIPDCKYVGNPAQISPFDPYCIFYKDKDVWPAVVYGKPGTQISIANQSVQVPEAGKSVVITVGADGRIKKVGQEAYSGSNKNDPSKSSASSTDASKSADNQNNSSTSTGAGASSESKTASASGIQNINASPSASTSNSGNSTVSSTSTSPTSTSTSTTTSPKTAASTSTTTPSNGSSPGAANKTASTSNPPTSVAVVPTEGVKSQQTSPLTSTYTIGGEADNPFLETLAGLPSASIYAPKLPADPTQPYPSSLSDQLITTVAEKQLAANAPVINIAGYRTWPIIIKTKAKLDALINKIKSELGGSLIGSPDMGLIPGIPDLPFQSNYYGYGDGGTSSGSASGSNTSTSTTNYYSARAVTATYNNTVYTSEDSPSPSAYLQFTAHVETTGYGVAHGTLSFMCSPGQVVVKEPLHVIVKYVVRASQNTGNGMVQTVFWPVRIKSSHEISWRQQPPPSYTNTQIPIQKVEELSRYKGSFQVGGTDLGFIPTTTDGRNAAGATIPAEIVRAFSQVVPQNQSYYH